MMAAFDEIREIEKNCKQTYFLRNLLKKRIEFHLPKQETIDIIEAVEYLVELIVARIASSVDWLKVARVVRVGSMAEKTSIVKPDEFDYLVVLEQKGVEVRREKCRSGHAHIFVTDPNLRSVWGEWLNNGYLKGAFTRGIPDRVRTLLRPIKNEVLHWVKEQLLPSRSERYFNTLGDAFMVEVEKVIRENPLYSNRSTGKMIAVDIAKHGPAFMATFRWESRSRSDTFNITVDLTTAIEVDIPRGFIDKNDVFHEKFWNKLRKHGKMMLIPDHKPGGCEDGLCFRLTFTETEVELVKDLSRHHLDVYKLLKYVFNSEKSYSYMPSYAFKTMILKHSCFCKEKQNLAVCFKSIVAECIHYSFLRNTLQRFEPTAFLRLLFRGKKFELFIPSIFMKSHNILESRDYSVPCEVFLFEMESMLQSLHEISTFSCDTKFETLEKKLKIVNSFSSTAEGYIATLPIFNKTLKADYCFRCLEYYFRGNYYRKMKLFEK